MHFFMLKEFLAFYFVLKNSNNNKNQPRKGLQFAYFEIPSHKRHGCKGALEEGWRLEDVFL